LVNSSAQALTEKRASAKIRKKVFMARQEWLLVL
jgi:hypothetical protein